MRIRSGIVVSLLLLGSGLTGCAVGQIKTEPAPHAAEPLCAQVVLSLPQSLGTRSALSTTAQATAAWGDPVNPIVLHCGVESPGPTTDSCTTVSDAHGIEVDWISRARSDSWEFTTYGRNPAVRLVVPTSVAEDGAEFLIQLGPAVAQTPVSRSCM